MTRDRLLSLIIKRLDEELPPEEILELNEWGNECAANRQVLNIVNNESKLAAEIQEWQKIDPSLGYSRWRDLVRARQKSLVRRIAGWSTAAAAIIAAGIIGVTHKTSRLSPPAQLMANVHPVPPGRNTATLTLANGQRLLLDNAAKDIGRQGNAEVVKLDSRSLAYSVKAGNAAGPMAYNVLTTPRAGQYQVILPDGSHAWLNNLSSLRYPTTFRGKNRRVELTGEAYFEIAKDGSKPFIVGVNGEDVEVLGTSFNIMAYIDEESTQTTLVSGTVRVKAGQSAVTLRPDEQAKGSKAGDLKILEDVPSQDIISWKDGFFYFGRASFTEVMRQLSRWYDVDVRYEGPVPDLEFGGKIDRSLPLNDLLNFLDKNKVHLRLEGRTLVVLPS
jgi:transmembrane sensor